MDKKRPKSIFLLYIFILFSCVTEDIILPFPPPDINLFGNEKAVEIENITGSRDMGEEPHLPDWLSAFLAGGIEEAEKLEAYEGRYLFIASNQGMNFAALSRWADNFSVEYDFPMLVAARIEKRMNVSNSIYPDEEFGVFYETFVKSAYTGEYNRTIKEDIYWIKVRESGASNNVEGEDAPEVFIFYVLITVDAKEMQDIVNNLFSQALISSAPTGARALAINRLRQNFFEGF